MAAVELMAVGRFVVAAIVSAAASAFVAVWSHFLLSCACYYCALV